MHSEDEHVRVEGVAQLDHLVIVTGLAHDTNALGALTCQPNDVSKDRIAVGDDD
jgi:hypothetical protein